MRIMRFVTSPICLLIASCAINDYLSIPVCGEDVINFSQVTIDADPPAKPYYKMVGDISGDGFADIVVGGAKGPLIAYVWPEWKQVQLAEGGWDGVNGEIADVDGDGDNDIVMGGTGWFTNPGDGSGNWNRVPIDNEKAHDVELADLDLNGTLDVVVRDQSAFGGNGNWIAIFYQISPTNWKKVRFDCPHGEGIKLGDIDRDSTLR